MLQELNLKVLYQDAVISESIQEIGEHLDKVISDIDRIEMHLGINRPMPETNDSLSKAVLKSLLSQHRENLNYLRQQAALYTSPPLEIHNKIKETEREIERIVEELK